MSKTLLDKARALIKKEPSIGRHRLASLLGTTHNKARALLYEIQGVSAEKPLKPQIAKPAPVPLAEAELPEAIRKRLKTRKPASVLELCDLFNHAPKAVRAALEQLKGSGYNIGSVGDSVELTGAIVPGNAVEIVHKLADYRHRWRKFGVCGDKHLGNRQARLDVLNALYDIYESEGVTEVYDTGNWIDGEAGKLNKQELLVFGLDNQINYWIDNHPQRKGITTYFIAGDDHEGWYQQRECVEIGRYAELRAVQSGRQDLKYIGYVEGDIKLSTEQGHAWMKVMHPGGGSSYALSYTSQKMVESFQGGEKPQVLLMGHYHKINFGFPREVYVLDTGTCCDQTIFMRKKKLQAHVGGWLVEMNQAPDGHINRFKPEFFHFFDKGYYTGKLRKFVA